MTRPLVPVALVYAAGLLAGKYLSASPWPLFAIAFAFVFLSLAFSKLRPVLIWPMVFVVGWTNFSVRTSIISPFDLRRIGPEPAQIVTMRGELLETPVERIFHRDNSETSRTYARLRVHSLSRNGNASFDRLFDIHMKDVSGSDKAGSTVECGAGVIDIPKLLRTLAKLGYTGTLHFEHEKDAKDPFPGLAESVGYVRGVMAASMRSSWNRIWTRSANIIKTTVSSTSK